MTHYSVLSGHARSLFQLCSSLKKDGWYLAGGTALALQIGHRKSEDFDFFIQKNFLPDDLIKKFQVIFKNKTIEIIQTETDTLNVLIDSVKFSFFGYPYKLLEKTHEITESDLASIADIGCMKLSAITSRATEKDYIDLWFIFQTVSPESLFSLAKEKFPTLNLEVVKKGLVYFDDVEKMAIQFHQKTQPSLKTIETDFKKIVQQLKGS